MEGEAGIFTFSWWSVARNRFCAILPLKNRQINYKNTTFGKIILIITNAHLCHIGHHNIQWHICSSSGLWTEDISCCWYNAARCRVLYSTGEITPNILATYLAFWQKWVYLPSTRWYVKPRRSTRTTLSCYEQWIFPRFICHPARPHCQFIASPELHKHNLSYQYYALIYIYTHLQAKWNHNCIVLRNIYTYKSFLNAIFSVKRDLRCSFLKHLLLSNYEHLVSFPLLWRLRQSALR